MSVNGSNSESGMSRVTRSKHEAKASYDRMSRLYDMFGAFERKYKCAGLRKLEARDGEKILEIGFGTGHCILALAQSVGDRGRVCGIDISEGMCRVARARLEKSGLSQRVELHCGDAAQLPFKDNYFDAVFMSFALELFDTPEIPVVLRECRRVLKNNGRICVVTMSKKDNDTKLVRLYEWFHKMLPNYVDCRPIFCRRALVQAGFNIHDVTEMSMWGLPVEVVLAKK